MMNMKSTKTSRQNLCVIALNITLLMTIFFAALIVPVHAANTSVRVDPALQTVSYGSTFTIDIYCTPTQSIKSFELKVIYNPNLIRATSVTKGTIFGSYTTFFSAGTIDNTAGTISNIYDLILGTGSVSSSGTFVRISFTARSTAGTSSIKLSNVGVTNNLGYIPLTITDGGVQVTQQTNNPPVFDYITPANQSTNIPITTTAVSLTIRDTDSDDFDYTIQTSPNVGRVSVTGAHDGTKQCTLSGLKYGTTYRWYVNATDGVNWKRRWYTFTTTSAPSNMQFVFSNENPRSGSTNIPISTSTISLMIQNSRGHAFDYYIRTSPNVGQSSGVNRLNGTKPCSISGLAYSTTYTWYVSCKDVVTRQWTNQSYRFTTEAENSGGTTPPSGGGGGSTPPVEDPPATTPEVNTAPSVPSKPTGPTFIETGINYYFITTTFDSDNDGIRLRFDWGDDNISEWTGLVPSNVSASLSHTWKNASTYNITVIAQDQNGANSSWSEPLTVVVSQANLSEEPIVIEINASTDNLSTNQIVRFNVSNCSVPGNTIVSYHWEFGDGKVSSGKTAAHTYTAPGQYTVNLEITDRLGEIYNKAIIVTVAAAQSMAQGETSFLPILLTIILIGTVCLLIFLLILSTRENMNLQFFKKYLLYGKDWAQQMLTKMIRKQTPVVKTKPAEHPLPRVMETQPRHTTLPYPSIEKKPIPRVEDAEIAYIHERIDQLLMKL